MARKAKQTAQTDDLPSIWDDLGIPAPGGSGSVPAATAKPTGTKQDDDRTDVILSRLERLESDRTFAGYREPAGQQSQQYQFDPKTFQVDMSGLPDQTLHPAEYNAALAQRVNAAMLATREATKQETLTALEQRTAPQRLWEHFSNRHPDWAKHKAIVGAVGSEIIEEIRNRGVDAQRFIYQESDKFSDMIVERMAQKGYDRLLDDGADGPEDDSGLAQATVTTQARKRPSAPENDDELRTDDILGGIESGGAPSRGRGTVEKVDMISDMKAIQERLFNRPL